MRLYTVGHSNQPVAALIARLDENGVERVADVRAYPRSRKNPQFDADALCDALAAAGIEYRHLPALGGRRGAQRLGRPSPNTAWREPGFRNYADYALSPAFRNGLEAFLDLARERTCAVMCAEALWWQCHRRIIADYLLAAGAEVLHILGPGQVDPARPTPGSAPQGDGSIHYPGDQGELF